MAEGVLSMHEAMGLNLSTKIKQNKTKTLTRQTECFGLK
jgi:hypothetical protein